MNIMLDLETLGRRPGCQVLSIGAVVFGKEGLGAEFYCVLERHTQANLGLHVDAETQKWWDAQSPQARRVFSEPATEFTEGLSRFSDYIVANGGPGQVKMWGNGADFDNPILAAAYEAAGRSQPWVFWNSRCYRTLKSLPHSAGAMNRVGTYHNALDDAKSQAEHAVRILNSLYTKPATELRL